ncbi:MAG: EF-P 5-aminopentanol modification-associated protein YfmH [Bacillaceae bacterium]
METIVFEQLKETLYYEQMDNGLRVYILPKPGFNKTYATFTTKYGAIDNHFVPLDATELVKVPDGIAHFLEHKLFEKEHGDVFQDFSKQGASANAFTSFTRTSYLFSCTNDLEKNLTTLVNFVQEPYFTEKTVEKEKGIIGQEIKMYDDNPDWRLYYGLIEALYVNHPVRIDIAGTVESISHITKDLLYLCYNTFYHPSNMLLFVVGAVEPNTIMDLVRKNQQQKDFTNRSEIVRKFDEEPSEVSEKKKILKMTVGTPKCLVGLKVMDVKQQGKEMLKQELTFSLLLDYLFGKSTANYEQLYEDGLIDDSFFYDYSQEFGYGFIMVGGDTKEPDKLEEKIKNILFKTEFNEMDEAYLERAKRKKIGSFLRALNSPEFIANQFTRYAFNDMNLFDVVSMLECIKEEDVLSLANSWLKEEYCAVCQVLPNK